VKWSWVGISTQKMSQLFFQGQRNMRGWRSQEEKDQGLRNNKKYKKNHFFS
jgi:hypothetical protein